MSARGYKLMQMSGFSQELQYLDTVQACSLFCFVRTSVPYTCFQQAVMFTMCFTLASISPVSWPFGLQACTAQAQDAVEQGLLFLVFPFPGLSYS